MSSTDQSNSVTASESPVTPVSDSPAGDSEASEVRKAPAVPASAAPPGEASATEVEPPGASEGGEENAGGEEHTGDDDAAGEGGAEATPDGATPGAPGPKKK